MLMKNMSSCEKSRKSSSSAAVGAAENRATGLTARRRDEYTGLTLRHRRRRG